MQVSGEWTVDSPLQSMLFGDDCKDLKLLSKVWPPLLQTVFCDLLVVSEKRLQDMNPESHISDTGTMPSKDQWDTAYNSTDNSRTKREEMRAEEPTPESPELMQRAWSGEF